jgi:hypothetical protein
MGSWMNHEHIEKQGHYSGHPTWRSRVRRNRNLQVRQPGVNCPPTGSMPCPLSRWCMLSLVGPVADPFTGGEDRFIVPHSADVQERCAR